MLPAITAEQHVSKRRRPESRQQASAPRHLLQVEEGFGHFHTWARGDSPSSSARSPSAVSISFIPLNTRGLGDVFCDKLERLPAALAVAPLHLSARGEGKKIERAELAAADRQELRRVRNGD